MVNNKQHLYDGQGRVIGQPTFDNVTGERKFQDMLTISRQDLNWLTEKAHSAIFNNVPQRRQEVEMRRARLETMIDAVVAVHESHRRTLASLNIEVVTIRAEVINAIEGLAQFLTSLLTLPMADETRAAIQGQLDGIATHLAEARAAAADGAGRTV